MISAIEFGEEYESCEEAMIWRHSLPDGTSQAEAYLICPRGDWLVWQLTRKYVDYEETKLALERATEKIVARAIRRAVKSLQGKRDPWATEYRDWASRWLSGEDRSYTSAITHAYASHSASYAYSHTPHVHAAASAASYAFACTAYSASRSAAADAAAASVTRSQELKLQAQDIRSEIPSWPGEK